jgi:hypothetical protein
VLLEEKTMKKRMGVALMLLVCVLLYGTQAKAQAPKRIQFATGQSSTVIKGTTGHYGVTYIVRAKSGQKLVLNLTPTSHIGIKVETAKAGGEMVLLREEKGGIYEIGLEENGDYTIFIGSTHNKPVSFTLTVSIAKLADL